MTKKSYLKSVSPPDSSSAGYRAWLKGQQTKKLIIDAALRLASQIGLSGLSIGAVAEAAQMSKSGVFSHFGSREELQISVIREYQTEFQREVFAPSLKLNRGLDRLKSLFDHWVIKASSEINSGCIYISGAVEFDDRSGPVRDALVSSITQWQEAFIRMIKITQECGHLDSQADPAQIAFEIHGLILVLHYEARFMQHPDAENRVQKGFSNIIERYSNKTNLLNNYLAS